VGRDGLVGGGVVDVHRTGSRFLQLQVGSFSMPPPKKPSAAVKVPETLSPAAPL
jgi:hypothetical protein